MAIILSSSPRATASAQTEATSGPIVTGPHRIAEEQHKRNKSTSMTNDTIVVVPIASHTQAQPDHPMPSVKIIAGHSGPVGESTDVRSYARLPRRISTVTTADVTTTGPPQGEEQPQSSDVSHVLEAETKCIWPGTNLAGVTVLPVETLCQIFSVTIDEARERVWPLAPDPRFYDSIQTLMAVSKSWRNMILGSPTLWSTVLLDGIKPSAVALIISRSGKSTPLSVQGKFIDGDGNEDANSRKLKLVLRESHRIRKLYLEVSDKYLRMLGSGKGMPKLEELTLTRTLSRSLAVSRKLPSLRALRSPRLQNIALYDVPFRAYQVLLSGNVQDLTLITDITPLLSTDDILSSLRSVPNLRSLTMLAAVKSKEVRWPQPVVLPKLEELEIEPNEVVDVKFLDYIGAPKLTSVNCHILSPFSSDDTEVAKITDLLAPLVNQIARYRDFRRCEIRKPDEYNMGVELINPRAVSNPTMKKEGLYFSVDHLEQAKILGVLTSFDGSLNRVTDLMIREGASPPEATDAWHNLLNLMAEVRTLHIHGRDLAAIPSGFIHNEEGAPRRILPVVESITVEGVSKMEGSINHLLRLFQHRGNAKHRINLRIVNAIDIAQSDVDSLDTLVENVYWDGVVSGSGGDVNGRNSDEENDNVEG
ncbi:hypothetical protein GLOTRDRAFT_133813 [Gloeophyllum trabeum ATCC 11539]|uniref:Uncharacterized protein n=1 Tax=Gloeophyllum trabeum (strain ATCC 11539 / FP-39264 / Madison 617) TaxID=670483 RepID=S7PSC4_GLOTA|nr:uncharacterized protein GLOTRDRAFT_133813 [Gloeophyllum trabeum ATCC 11539]EPQ50711.1 hypothetical protein GLOTRDRAFT_133813 [Gloeophyllum trabeum ATCC 11539]